MPRVPNCLSAPMLLLASLVVCGSIFACGPTTASTTEPTDEPGEATEAAVEPVEDVTTAVADAGTPAPEASTPLSGPGGCEGIVGSVRSDLPLPSKLGEVVVMAFPVGVLGEDGFPKQGMNPTAQFATRPDEAVSIAPVVPPVAETTPAEGEEADTSEPEAPGLRVGFHLCLDKGEYDVIAFMDANNDTRIWNPGDHFGTARVSVPGEVIINADVRLTVKVAAGQGKTGKASDYDQPGPGAPDAPK